MRYEAFELENVIVECVQGKLQAALMHLGMFETVVDEVLAWLDETNRRLDDNVPLYSDPKLIETELSKLKVRHSCCSFPIDANYIYHLFNKLYR